MWTKYQNLYSIITLEAASYWMKTTAIKLTGRSHSRKMITHQLAGNTIQHKNFTFITRTAPPSKLACNMQGCFNK